MPQVTVKENLVKFGLVISQRYAETIRLTVDGKNDCIYGYMPLIRLKFFLHSPARNRT